MDLFENRPSEDFQEGLAALLLLMLQRKFRRLDAKTSQSDKARKSQPCPEGSPSPSIAEHLLQALGGDEPIPPFEQLLGIGVCDQVPLLRINRSELPLKLAQEKRRLTFLSALLPTEEKPLLAELLLPSLDCSVSQV